MTIQDLKTKFSKKRNTEENSSQNYDGVEKLNDPIRKLQGNPSTQDVSNVSTQSVLEDRGKKLKHSSKEHGENKTQKRNLQ